MPNENTIEIINQNYIIEIDTPQYSIFTENTINIDYNYAVGKPQINSVELNGNKSAKDLGLVDFSDIELKENISNKVTVLDENSTDIEYPSAKCVNDLLQLKVNTDLSIMSEQGQAKFDAKADKSELNNKANKDLNNVVEIAEGSLVDNELKNKLNNQQITNCLLEVPQKIKLELNDGVLTLKAGSQVIVPNGAGVFDEVVIESDLTHATTVNSKLMLVFYNNSLAPFLFSKCYSGATAPTTSGSGAVLWFDTTNNKMKISTDNGATWRERSDSLPIAIVTADGTSYTSIDQVFNGFGYIGSHIWMDKGVKLLIADGYNEDGTIKNEEIVTPNVIVARGLASGTRSDLIPFLRKYPVSNELQLFPIVKAGFLGELDYVPTVGAGFQYYFNTNDMKWYMHESGATEWVSTPYYIISPPITVANNVITSFKPYKTFRAVEYDKVLLKTDKSEISSWGMPSDKSVDLTLGASGTTYTAPANGWLVFGKRVGATTAQYILLINETANMRIVDTIKGDINNELGAYLPVNKGDKVRVDYNATGATTSFKFHYAEGEV